MPRTKEQNARIREQRRQSILQAAIPLFAQHGYADTAISAVARAAGISHGAVFLYFSTKDDLFRAAVTEPLRTMEEASGIGQDGGSPLQQLEQLVRRQMEFIIHGRDVPRLAQYVLAHRDRFPEIAEELFAFADRFCRALIPLIQKGQEEGELLPGDPLSIALAYFGYINGIALVNFGSSDDTAFWEAMISLGLRIFGPVEGATP